MCLSIGVLEQQFDVKKFGQFLRKNPTDQVTQKNIDMGLIVKNVHLLYFCNETS